jgi:hypothetical protein
VFALVLVVPAGVILALVGVSGVDAWGFVVPAWVIRANACAPVMPAWVI